MNTFNDEFEPVTHNYDKALDSLKPEEELRDEDDFYSPEPDFFKEIPTAELIEKVKETIIGQDEAVTSICSFMNMEIKKINYNLGHSGEYDFTPQRTKNMMISGPSGCGKTATVIRVCEEFGIPCVMVDASSKVPTGYKGNEWYTMISDAIRDIASTKTRGNIAEAVRVYNEGCVIVLDEFDKAIIPDENVKNYSRISQGCLLKILEGATFTLDGLGLSDIDIENKDSIEINTSNTIFIAVGSFANYLKIMKESVEKELRQQMYDELNRMDGEIENVKANKEAGIIALKNKEASLEQEGNNLSARLAALQIEQKETILKDIRQEESLKVKLAGLQGDLEHCRTLISRSRAAWADCNDDYRVHRIGFVDASAKTDEEALNGGDYASLERKARMDADKKAGEIDQTCQKIARLEKRIAEKKKRSQVDMDELQLKIEKIQLKMKEMECQALGYDDTEMKLTARKAQIKVDYIGRIEKLKNAKQSDITLDGLIKYYDLTPELAGRMGSLVVLDQLKEKDMIRILKSSDRSDLSQTVKLLADSGITLTIPEDSYKILAKMAMKENVGARGLASVLDRIMYRIFPLVEGEDGKEVILTPQCIRGRDNPEIRNMDERFMKCTDEYLKKTRPF